MTSSSRFEGAPAHSSCRARHSRYNQNSQAARRVSIGATCELDGQRDED